jgi:hypothetical protein
MIKIGTTKRAYAALSLLGIHKNRKLEQNNNIHVIGCQNPSNAAAEAISSLCFKIKQRIMHEKILKC